jgi:hypothetical protein
MGPLWRCWLPHGKRTASRACLAERHPEPASEWQAPRLTWVQADRLLALPRWKRFVLMHVVPVCLAMVWQLVMAFIFLVGCLLGLTLIELLLP